MAFNRTFCLFPPSFSTSLIHLLCSSSSSSHSFPPFLPSSPPLLSSFILLVDQVRVARVQTCDLAWNQIRRDGAKSIGMALHKNEELEKLNLAYNALASGETREQVNKRTGEQETK